MNITKQGNYAYLPFDYVLVTTADTAVTFVRDLYEPIELEVLDDSDNLAKVLIPTSMTEGWYDWYYGKNKGLLEVAGTGETTVSYSGDCTVIEYPDAVWGDMQYNTNNLINDNATNRSQTWSSQKISQHVSGITLDIYTRAETDALLSGKTDVSAMTNYYTTAQTDYAINAAVSGKADASVLTGYTKYTFITKTDWSNLQNREENKWYVIVGDVTNPEGTVEGLYLGNVEITDKILQYYYTSTQVDNLISGAVSGKVDTSALTQTLLNYYTTGQTYSKTQVDALISGLSSFNVVVVQTLPTTGDSHTIYLVPATTASTTDYYDEYLYVNNAWELVGSTRIDMSNYLTSAQTMNAISAATSGLVGSSAYTVDEGVIAEAIVRNRNAINTKQDILVAGLNIKTINSATTLGSGNVDLVTPLQLDTRTNEYYKRTTIDDRDQILLEALRRLFIIEGNDVSSTP